MSTADRRLLLVAQDFAYRRTLAHAAVSTIAVIQERRAVTEDAARQMLSARNARGGKVGCCIIVGRPTFVPDQDDGTLRGVLFQDLLVLELPTLNEGSQGTGQSAEEVALELFQLFVGVPLARYSQQAYAAAPDGAVVPDDTFDGFNGWRTRLQVAVSCPRDTRCGLVLISPDEGAAPQTVTLSTATAGATIRYTLDGSYPEAGNAAALVYSAPLSIASPCTLLAAAEKTGLQQSGLSQAIFS